MDAATLATAVTSLGVVFGWQAMPDDQQKYEAIVQLDPELATLVAQGGSVPVAVEVPPEIQPIGRIRIVVGKTELPRQRLVTAMKPVGEAPDDAIRLTQYNQPIAGGSPSARYGAPAATGFDPYAKPVAAGSAAAATTPTATTTNPWTQPYQQAAPDVREAYQQAQQQAQLQAEQWAQRQSVGIQNQLRSTANDALGRAQQVVEQSTPQYQAPQYQTPQQPYQGPTIDQLFGGNATTGRQGPAANSGDWSQNNWNQQGTPQSNPTVGTRPLQRAFEPIRDGVDRIDDRLREAADNVTDRTRQLFDHLGRPIRSVADRQRSLLAGRNDAYNAAAPSAASVDPRSSYSSAAPYYPPANPFNNETAAPRYEPYRDPQQGDYRTAESADDPRSTLPTADRSQDDRDWESTRRTTRPWPEIPQSRPNAERQQESYPGSSRWDLADRRAQAGDRQPGGSGNDPRDAWAEAGPQLPGNDSQRNWPAIERRMLATPASAPVENVADELLRFPSDPVGLDLSGGTTPGLDPDLTASPFSTAGGQRPSAADLGWGGTGSATARPPEVAAESAPAQHTAGAQQAATTTSAEDNQASPLGLLLAWLLLSGSIAGNVYLFWSYLDVRNKYSSLIRKSARSVRSRFATA